MSSSCVDCYNQLILSLFGFSPFSLVLFLFFFFNDTATTEIYTLSLHDALPISLGARTIRRVHEAARGRPRLDARHRRRGAARSEEHTSELQSLRHLVCRLLLEKKKKKQQQGIHKNTQEALELMKDTLIVTAYSV